MVPDQSCIHSPDTDIPLELASRSLAIIYTTDMPPSSTPQICHHHLHHRNATIIYTTDMPPSSTPQICHHHLHHRYATIIYTTDMPPTSTPQTCHQHVHHRNTTNSYTTGMADMPPKHEISYQVLTTWSGNVYLYIQPYCVQTHSIYSLIDNSRAHKRVQREESITE